VEIWSKRFRPSLAAAGLATAALLLCSNTASAQITKMVDEHGKTVWVNADSPKPHHGSTISSASASLPVHSATLGESTANAFPGTAPSYAEPKPLERETLVQLPPVRPLKDSPLDRIVNETAERNHIDVDLVRAVITAESGWNARAISRKGAVGLMQLIPSTGFKYGARNLFDPAQNVEAGTLYLKSLLARYDGDLSKTLAAYNAGENAVDRFGGVPAYAETQKYVQKVSDRYFSTSSGDALHWAPPKKPVRKVADTTGRVTFTNE
jgi:Transglycosylase SLT domain